jgi:hypothetical protein
LTATSIRPMPQTPFLIDGRLRREDERLEYDRRR